VNCNEVVEIVTEYLERTLAAEERARLEAHLETCEGCETYVTQMRQTVAALRDLDSAEEPRELDSLLAEFRARRP
jgi:anti-sigma factor RsiW